ncbi:MAG: glycosyltransferase family 2 protein, partial [Bacteroidetes bacterium]|nr:glycosyltransferase family 2 protein [Bacteroidota bacterium]
MTPFAVSVLIPAYNEEEIIQSAVGQALDILIAVDADFEIIVVNDGSTDSTAQVLDTHFADREFIQVYHKLRNEGFGSAVRTGISLAQKRHLLCVPADSPLTPDLYEAFCSHAHRADVLISYRRAKIGYSWIKHFNSYVYHQLVSLL